MKSKLDWKGVGQFVAVIVKLMTTITSTMKSIKVDIEILDWLTGAGKNEFVAALKQLGEGYKKTLSVPASAQKKVDEPQITRDVTVKADQTPEQAIADTGRKQYVNNSVVTSMPRGSSGAKKVIFFKVGRWINDNDLEKEYVSRGLKPTDPFSLAAVNAADPVFADKYPNGTHWKDANGNWCYAAFDRWHDERRVLVFRRDSVWLDSWRFAGEQVEPQA